MKPEEAKLLVGKRIWVRMISDYCEFDTKAIFHVAVTEVSGEGKKITVDPPIPSRKTGPPWACIGVRQIAEWGLVDG